MNETYPWHHGHHRHWHNNTDGNFSYPEGHHHHHHGGHHWWRKFSHWWHHSDQKNINETTDEHKSFFSKFFDHGENSTLSNHSERHHFPHFKLFFFKIKMMYHRMFDNKNLTLPQEIHERLQNVRPLADVHMTVEDIKSAHSKFKQELKLLESSIESVKKLKPEMEKLIEREKVFKNIIKQFETSLNIDNLQHKIVPSTILDIVQQLKDANDKLPVITKEKKNNVLNAINQFVNDQQKLNITVSEQDETLKQLESHLAKVPQVISAITRFFFGSNSTETNATASNETNSIEDVTKHIEVLEQIRSNIEKEKIDKLKNNKLQIEQLKENQEKRLKDMKQMEDGINDAQSVRLDETKDILEYIKSHNPSTDDEAKLEQVKNLASVLVESY